MHNQQSPVNRLIHNFAEKGTSNRTTLTLPHCRLQPRTAQESLQRHAREASAIIRRKCAIPVVSIRVLVSRHPHSQKSGPRRLTGCSLVPCLRNGGARPVLIGSVHTARLSGLSRHACLDCPAYGVHKAFSRKEEKPAPGCFRNAPMPLGPFLFAKQKCSVVRVRSSCHVAVPPPSKDFISCGPNRTEMNTQRM